MGCTKVICSYLWTSRNSWEHGETASFGNTRSTGVRMPVKDGWRRAYGEIRAIEQCGPECGILI